MKVAVLGAGSWGTALATVFTINGHQTMLWARRTDLAQEVTTEHTNRRYLPDSILPPGLLSASDLQKCVNAADLVVFAVPSATLSDVASLVRPYIKPSMLLAHAVKGFDLPTQRRISEVLRDTFPENWPNVCVISGPSHAEEVVNRLPTTLVVASPKRTPAEKLQDALMNLYMRVYTNPDVVGCEVGGSLKNIIALGVGIADGLGFGDNAKAALMTRGLAEIARLGMQMGASPLTFAGLSGVGDLVVTCTSRHSRNFRAGRLLGQGHSLDETLKTIGMVVEGVTTTRATMGISRKLSTEMPITTAIYGVLFDGKGAHEAVESLMGRARGREIEEVARDTLWADWQ
jgi:glycerol-3-phosphate dehydrogenase (NAD(P)+)